MLLLPTDWHTKRLEEVYERLSASPEGLTQRDATERLREVGTNELPEVKRETLFSLFTRQFASPLIFVLLGAAVLVLLIGEIADGLIILAVLVFNAVVGTIQEGRAQNTLHALRKFVSASATVLRDGHEKIVDGTELVPGDIILLEEGEKVPADARLISAKNIKVDEAALTGESTPVDKTETLMDGELGSTRAMVYKGTNIVSGHGRAIVVATGVETTIGKIAQEVSVIDTEIPLSADIRHLSHVILWAVAGMAVTLFTIGFATGRGLVELFTTVIALSVSVIPEGLPLVLTLVLATGVWRMSKRHALVKRLTAVEALGQATHIAVDKTGTLTKNELMVERIFVDGVHYRVTGSGYSPEGVVQVDERDVAVSEHPGLAQLARVAALASSAHVVPLEKGEWRVTGDPTQAAVQVAARKIGMDRNELEKEHPLIAEQPFEYQTKFQAALHTEGKHVQLSVIGAPEVVLERASHLWHSGTTHALTEKRRDELTAEFLALSEAGLRVVAGAYKHMSAQTHAVGDVQELVFLGFFAMKDVVRPEVPEALRRAQLAGMKVVMITGDHAVTARAVAREVGIYQDGDVVLSGAELDRLTDGELAARVTEVTVYARVTPEHKLKIIEAYRKRKIIVAMTGDGVNDAPSLVAADLGVAMGKIGTDVAKEAADIVLLDDNFGSIVSAVEEGRSIYRTIKKVVLYLFSTNVGEVLTILGALLLSFPLPILASQIIWLNFVTDGFLDAALAMEPKEKGLLTGKFKKPPKYLVDSLMAVRIVVMAIPMAVGALLMFSLYADDYARAITMTLTTLAVFQWFNAWNVRSERESIFALPPLSNLYLVGATGIVVMLQLVAVYTPFLQSILHTVPLSALDWALVIITGASIVVVEEVRKALFRTYVPAR